MDEPGELSEREKEYILRASSEVLDMLIKITGKVASNHIHEHVIIVQILSISIASYLAASAEDIKTVKAKVLENLSDKIDMVYRIMVDAENDEKLMEMIQKMLSKHRGNNMVQPVGKVCKDEHIEQEPEPVKKKVRFKRMPQYVMFLNDNPLVLVTLEVLNPSLLNSKRIVQAAVLNETEKKISHLELPEKRLE